MAPARPGAKMSRSWAFGSKGEVELTLSCAVVDAHRDNLDAYLAGKAAIERLAQEEAQAYEFAYCRMSGIAADAPTAGHIFLTVPAAQPKPATIGQVVRGNCANGFITPGRP